MGGPRANRASPRPDQSKQAPARRQGGASFWAEAGAAEVVAIVSRRTPIARHSKQSGFGEATSAPLAAARRLRPKPVIAPW
jgi:hypothetical protein